VDESAQRGEMTQSQIWFVVELCQRSPADQCCSMAEFNLRHTKPLVSGKKEANSHGSETERQGF
jgi:hypothetical protein